MWLAAAYLGGPPSGVGNSAFTDTDPTDTDLL